MIESKRLKFTELDRGSFNKIAPMMKNPDVMYAWEHTFSDSQINDWIDRRITGYKKHGYDYFMAVLKDSGETVGQIGLVETEIGLSLGYIIDKPYQRKGYAFEGANAMLSYAFNILSAEKVVADIRPQNTASVSLIKKLGFAKTGYFVKQYNGTDMPHDIYELSQNEYRERNDN